jgi:thiol-disulfide isomerase/thioredoxin
VALLRAASFAAVTLAATLAHAGAVGVGDAAPDVTFADWQGGKTTLSARRGRVVVLDFWATWCTTCRAALPGLDAIARRHPEVTILAASIDDSKPAAERFLGERLPDTAMILLHDPGGAILARFGASGMPAVYILDRDGVVRLAKAGYTTEHLSAIESAVKALSGSNP